MTIPLRHTADAVDPSPLRSMLRHWRTTLILGIVGLLLGLGTALATPTTYTAEARLAVAPDSNNAFSIAGFPLAARDLAANYARWVQNNTSTGTWSVPGVTKIEATPIPETTVIRIEAEAASADAAVQGAQTAADRLAQEATAAQRDRDPQKAYAAFQQLIPQVLEAQTAVTEAEADIRGGKGSRAAQQKLMKARQKLAEVQLLQDGNSELYKRLYSDTMGITQLKTVAPAAVVKDTSAARFQRWGLLGLGAGLAAGLILSTLKDRKAAARRRLTTAGEIPGNGTGPGVSPERFGATSS